MVLGCYYLTLVKNKNFRKVYKKNIATKYYFNISNLVSDYTNNKIHLHTPVWLKCKNSISVQTLFNIKVAKDINKPLEIRIDTIGTQYQYVADMYSISKQGTNMKLHTQFYRTTPGRVLMNQLIHINDYI